MVFITFKVVQTSFYHPEKKPHVHQPSLPISPAPFHLSLWQPLATFCLYTFAYSGHFI